MTAPDASTEGSTDSGTPWTWHVDVPLLGPVGWPPTGSLAFVVVIAGLAALEVITVPVAVAVGLGHVLARDHDHHVLHEIGAGLESA